GPYRDDDYGGVRPQDVVRLVVAGGEPTGTGKPPEEAERGYRLERRGPHGVVVDRTGHHRDERLVRRQFGHWHEPDPQRLADVLVVSASEHLDVLDPDMRGEVLDRNLSPLQLIRGRVIEDDFGHGVHVIALPSLARTPSRCADHFPDS